MDQHHQLIYHENQVKKTSSDSVSTHDSFNNPVIVSRFLQLLGAADKKKNNDNCSDIINSISTSIAANNTIVALSNNGKSESVSVGGSIFSQK